MNILKKKTVTLVAALITALIFLIFAALFTVSGITHAQDSGSQSSRLITIHDRGVTKVVLTKATTIGNAIADAGIPIDKKDMVEPDVNQKLIATHYQVNIYRARPVLVIDGNIRQKIITPYQTPLQIAAGAGIVVYPEDITTIDRVDDLVSGAGLQMTIKRAIPFEFTLYGKTSTVRTQASTVGGMLSEKGIKLTKDDRVSPGANSKIVFGLPVRVWREGKQTITFEEVVNFDIEKIQDADRPVGYLNITTPGVTGTRNVTYEIVVQDGQEISRKEIASLTTRPPVKQVEVVGAKLAFSGDFAAALAKLRSCEGGYNSWNASGPYYGAYQFDRQTWGTVANPADYGSASPAEQDNAAYQLYLRRGWHPWPVCGAAVLPDIYR
ncbi:MAG: ubiquitin-like domain-containing protein [Candidatus Saccharibacteria bacterium]|nr:ubiquitin-like domain-containing protein [Candidatus Saccharibacteria bacterium]